MFWTSEKLIIIVIIIVDYPSLPCGNISNSVGSDFIWKLNVFDHSCFFDGPSLITAMPPCNVMKILVNLTYMLH